VTPPSSFEDQVLFNICGELKERGGIDKDDQVRTELVSAYLTSSVFNLTYAIHEFSAQLALWPV